MIFLYFESIDYRFFFLVFRIVAYTIDGKQYL